MNHEEQQQKQEEKPHVPATHEDFLQAQAVFLQRHEARQTIRKKRRRIDVQLTEVQITTQAALRAQQRASRKYSDALGGVEELTLQERGLAKTAFDAAMVTLNERKAERGACLNGLDEMDRQLLGVDKDVQSAWLNLRDITRRFFRSKYSKSWLFASGQEMEFNWRSVQLEHLLAGLLTSQDVPGHLTAIGIICDGKSFNVTVTRGFRFVKERRIANKTVRDISEYKPGQEIAIPKAFPAHFAFEQLSIGRVALAV